MRLVQSVALCTFFIAQQCLASGVKNLVVFGDSYSDTGNMQKLSNGPLWSESLAVGWNASLYSFAFDGAVCDNDLFGKDDTAMPSIKDQVEMYYNQKMDLKPEETVYAFWIGMNDIERAFALDNATTMWSQVVDCLSNQMRNVRKVFGSNRFLVLNIPPLDLLPYYAKSEIAATRGKAATEFNALLSRHVINLNKHHQSLEMDLIDVHAMLQDIVESPDQFGFKDATHAYWDACQGRCTDKIDDYVWWDKAHLTGGAHRAIANDILLSGSLEPAVSLKSPSEVEELIASDDRFRSPKYSPQFSTGAVEKAVQEAVASKTAETSTSSPEDWSEETDKEDNTSSGRIYFALMIIALFCIAFVWFTRRKSRKSNLFALSNLVKSSNSRGRFVPLRTVETSA